MKFDEFKEQVEENFKKAVEENEKKDKFRKILTKWVNAEERERESIIHEMYTIRGEKIADGFGIDSLIKVYRMASISIRLKKGNAEEGALFELIPGSSYCCYYYIKEIDGKKRKIRINSNNNTHEVDDVNFDILICINTSKLANELTSPCWGLYKSSDLNINEPINMGISSKSVCFSELCDDLKAMLKVGAESAIIDDKQIIYYGPPGTGKTRKAKIEAVKIVTGNNCSDIDALNLFEGRINNKGTNEEKENDKKNIEICEEQIQIVQFHPSYSYNEFMETIDARGINKDGVFKKIANDARNHPDKKYVLIIDEINRANVSEVLGELLYGIEYRGQKITTGISNDDFSVPENLYIIGTMNTADRSLQALDYAVRRRFTFKKVKAELPDPKPPEQKEDVKDEGCYEIANGQFFCQNIFKKVQEDVMKSVARGIDPEDIMPGISYFLVNGKNKKTESDPDSYDEDHLKYKMEYELIPLLREYAKNGMFTKRKKLELEEESQSLIELLHSGNYLKILLTHRRKLSESEKK